MSVINNIICRPTLKMKEQHKSILNQNCYPDICKCLINLERFKFIVIEKKNVTLVSPHITYDICPQPLHFPIPTLKDHIFFYFQIAWKYG